MVRYRAATREDLRFILASWARSFSHTRKAPEGLAPKHYRAALRATIADILRRPTARAVVACNPNNPNLIWGFAVFEDTGSPVLHYCYVKELFRGNGIGSHLVQIARGNRPGVMRYSYRTPACHRFLAGAEYDRRLLRPRKAPHEQESAQDGASG